MSLTKISNRSSTALPRVESRSRKRPQLKRGKVTIFSHLSSLSSEHLPLFRDLHFIAAAENVDTKAGDCEELMKIYDDLLIERMKNEVLIEYNDKKINEKMRELEDVLQQTDEERMDAVKVTREHTNAMRKMKDFEAEYKRVKARKSEQKQRVAQLENKNKGMLTELRNLINKITDAQNRIEHGPEYMKAEMERCQREADELENENEVLNVEVEQKATELNDLRTELIMQESDSDESDDENEELVEHKKQQEEPCSNDTRCITPALRIPNFILSQETPEDIKLNLSDLRDKVPLPPIRQRELCDGTVQKPYEPNLNSNKFLPPIERVTMHPQANSPLEISRNILYRGTSTTSKKAFFPKPPTSGSPSGASRRRKTKRS